MHPNQASINPPVPVAGGISSKHAAQEQDRVMRKLMGGEQRPVEQHVDPESIAAAPTIPKVNPTNPEALTDVPSADVITLPPVQPLENQVLTDEALARAFFSRFTWQRIFQFYLQHNKPSLVEVQLEQLTLNVNSAFVRVTELSVMIGFDPKTVNFSLKDETSVKLVVEGRTYSVLYVGHVVKFPELGFNLMIFFIDKDDKA